MAKNYLGRPYAWRTVLRDVRAKPKLMAEDCLVLSMKELLDKGLIENGGRHAGSWSYADLNTFHFHGPISYEADLREEDNAWLRLRYEADGVSTDHCILLSASEPPLGGRRWYFRCPLRDIRVTKLYLPPGARRFASREAHGLIHRSQFGSRRQRECAGGGLLVAIETIKLA
jgi:hypothetical protein